MEGPEDAGSHSPYYRGQKKLESLTWGSHTGFKGRWKEGDSGTCQLLGLGFRQRREGGVSFRKGKAGKEGLSPWQRKEIGLLRSDDWVNKV